MRLRSVLTLLPLLAGSIHRRPYLNSYVGCWRANPNASSGARGDVRGGLGRVGRVVRKTFIGDSSRVRSATGVAPEIAERV